MKRVAVLVIASTKQPVYVHYIETFWSDIIRRTNAALPHISVFLLFEHDVELDRFGRLANNIIRDPTNDYESFCAAEHQKPGVPGILLKTVYALELLHHRYDIFFRTNLSSMLKVSAFDRYVQAQDDLRYSSALVWVDALRQQLEQISAVGPERSIRSLDELDDYEGNSFASGCGFFLNQAEARSLVERKARLRFDIVDDISVGLMFPSCEVLPGFTHIARADEDVQALTAGIVTSKAPHIRLQHLTHENARALWAEIGDSDVWK